MADMAFKPVVLCGPSGSGKSTLVKKLMEEFQGCFAFTISRKFSSLCMDIILSSVKSNDLPNDHVYENLSTIMNITHLFGKYCGWSQDFLSKLCPFPLFQGRRFSFTFCQTPFLKFVDINFNFFFFLEERIYKFGN